MESAAALFEEMTERLARLEAQLSGLSLVEKKKDPPAREKTPVKKSQPKSKGTKSTNHLPFGYDDVTLDEVKVGIKLVVNPDCSSPFKGKQIKVEAVSKAGDKVTFFDKKKQKKTTQVKYLVKPKPSPSQVMAQKAVKHYGLESNDIFLTPEQAFQTIADHLGMTLEEAKKIWDPCPPPDKHGNFAVDGRTVEWKPLTFCNPPFSQWPEWRDKAVAEAKQGKRVILLISASSYFLTGKDKKQDWHTVHREVDIEFIKWCDYPMGIIHTLKWGPNEVTGEKTGGPPLGVIIMDIKQRGKQYSKPVGSPGAHSVSSLGEIEVSVEEIQLARQRRAQFLQRTASVETQDLPSPTDTHTTWGTSMEGAQFTMLEMFCGTGSVGKVVSRIPGAKVFSVDINPETLGYHPSKVADILTLDFTKLKFVPDVIWCSPPCRTYSIMAGGKHRTKAIMEPKTEAGIIGREILQKTLDMINYFMRVRITLTTLILDIGLSGSTNPL